MPGTKHLTDALCRKQKPPDKGMAVTWDDDCKGFGYRITAAKARSFVLNYRTAGRQRQMTIGSFPDWDVTRARVKAREYKRDIDSGGDPLAERDQLRSAPTVSDLVERYRKDSLPRKRPSTQKTQTSYLQKHILPALGSRKVASITHTDMDVLHRRIKAPMLANRCVSFCSAMFNLAVRLDWIERNPCKGVERNPEQPRHRYLSGDEISRLMAALDRHPGQGANAIRLLLLTGARRMEVLGATWSQFDLVEGIWTKPHTSTKQARMHRVPLSEAVLTILRDMRSVVDQRVASAKADGRILRVRQHVFPSMFGAGPHQIYLDKIWSIVCKDAGITGCRVHDLRHSFASILVSGGQSLQVIGAMIGHTQADTTLRYSHLYDSALRDAANIVGKSVTDAKPTVVRLKR